MTKDVSVLLVYRSKYKAIYELFKEFLNYIGVFAEEQIVMFDYDEIQSEDYSSIYCIEANQFEGKTLEEKLQIFKDNLFKKIENLEFFECYDDLAKVFINNKLMYAGANLEYFGTDRNNIELNQVFEQSKKSFENAADAINICIENNNLYLNNYYMNYARLYCKQKCNLAHFRCNKQVTYYVNDLAAEGLAISEKFSEYSKIWILLADVYDLSNNYGIDEIDALERCISMNTEKEYIGKCYYKLAKRKSEYSNFKKKAEVLYDKAYKLKPNYMITYGVAQLLMEDKRHRNAILLFEKCLNELEIRQPLNPEEVRYYFNIKVTLGYAYLNMEDYYNSILNCSQAIKLKKSIQDGNNDLIKFVNQFYDDSNFDSEKIIRICTSKMKTNQAYVYMAKAYQDTGMCDEADKYFELSKQS